MISETFNCHRALFKTANVMLTPQQEMLLDLGSQGTLLCNADHVNGL